MTIVRRWTHSAVSGQVDCLAIGKSEPSLAASWKLAHRRSPRRTVSRAMPKTVRTL